MLVMKLITTFVNVIMMLSLVLMVDGWKKKENRIGVVLMLVFLANTFLIWN